MDHSLSEGEDLRTPYDKPALSGVISNDKHGHLSKPDVYRRYVSYVTYDTKVMHLVDTSTKSIVYEIGRVGKDLLKQVMPRREPVLGEESMFMSQSVRMNTLLSTELMGLHKKYTNFLGVYDYMDLSAVGYQLAKAISYFNLTGKLTCNDIRAGKQLNIRALATASEPVTTNDSCVFIPRTTSTFSAPGAFCALVAAVNSYGSMVYTDVLSMTLESAPVIDEVSGAELAIGCFHGLRILLSMYKDAGHGSVMAYAITKGFHQMNSVVSHTDEGGFIRDMWRSCDFVRPYGGISFEKCSGYMGLPIPNAQNGSQLCAVVDTILLASAAASAQSDPCVTIDGRVYPTVYSSGLMLDKGIESEGDFATRMSKDLSHKIGADCGQFVENYVRNVGKLFGMKDESYIAVSHMKMAFNSHCDKENRHLKFRTVAPYYWIEPTSVATLSESVSDAAGFGPLVNPGEVTTVKLLPDAKVLAEQGFSALVSFEMRTARTVPLFTFLNNHLKNGLTHIEPLNYDGTKMFLKGGARACDEARNAHEKMNNYLWGRGQSMLCAPSECGYIGKRVACRFNFATTDDMFIVTNNHIPNLEELRSGTCSIRTSKPMRVNNDGIMSFSKRMLKDRNNAVRALEAARNVYNFSHQTGGEMFIWSNTEIDVTEESVTSSSKVTVASQPVPGPRSVVHEKRGPFAKRIIQDMPMRARLEAGVRDTVRLDHNDEEAPLDDEIVEEDERPQPEGDTSPGVVET
uniref:Capsid protein n=1 Tax=Phytophthora palustris toti-like virus 10 TaxID=2976304 RepID=A0A9E8YVW0_9VIRU|nr:capsid protein [Phytophthora palustris toti-like virus 10]